MIIPAYQQLLDPLLTCHNQEQAITYLSERQELLDDTLLELAVGQTLANEAAPEWHFVVCQLVARLLHRKWMYSYLSGQQSADKLSGYTDQHPEVFNQENYEELEEHLVTYAADEEMQQYLLTCQRQLVQLAIRSLLLNDEWPQLRSLLRYSRCWLTHPAATQYIEQLTESSTDTNWTQRIEKRVELLAQCLGDEALCAAFIREMDNGWADSLIRDTPSAASITLLRQTLATTYNLELWGLLQHQLGLTLSNLAADDQEPHQRAGIMAYKQALRVYTLQEQPLEWGFVQYHLGLAYRACRFGDMVQHVKQAIEAYQLALQILSKSTLPQDWALVQYNLGNAYRAQADQGEEAATELAIAAYEQALTVLSAEHHPSEWISVQHNLAGAYAERTVGNSADNLEQATAIYRQVLAVRTCKQDEQGWAKTQFNLGNTLLQRRSAQNPQYVEEAIIALKLALQVRTSTRFPILWAKTQVVLGHAYAARLLGDPSANREAAIEALTQALQTWSRSEHPHNWATQQLVLADHYLQQPVTDPVQFTEEAIRCLEEALEVLSPEKSAAEWAYAHEMLAGAYEQRTQGEHAENLEAALVALQQAGQIYTRAYDANKWAWNQHLQGGAYRSRLHGEQAENIELAIQAYKQALLVFNRTESAVKWAQTQNDLGIAYRNRLRGNKADNVERAIEAYLLTLQVHTREKYPQYWAMTHMNLGKAYKERQQGDAADNIELSIAAYEQALQVYTRANFPSEWAQLQLNLGAGYLKRSTDHPADNVGLAIAAYHRTLQVHTRERYPRYWAMAQNNLGLAYAEQIKRGATADLDHAVQAFTVTLQYYSSHYDTHMSLGVATNLGNLYFQQQQWADARAAYERAEAALRLELNETQRHESRQRLAQTGNNLYNRLIHCCLKLGEPAAAAAYALAGKSRSLTELLAGDPATLDQLVQQDLDLAAEWVPIQSLKAELDSLLVRLSAESDAGSTRFSPANQASDQARVDALHREITTRTDNLLFRYPALAAVRPLPLLTTTQIQALASALGGAYLLEYVFHYGTWGVFIITATEVSYISLADDLLEQLIDDTNALLNEQFWVKGGWPQDRSADLRRIYKLLIAPLRSHLNGATSVVIAPTSILHLMPFQALLDEKNEYLGLTYALSFVPSLTTLHVLWEQQVHSGPHVTTAQRLLNVACSGPARSYLANVQLEAKAIRDLFPTVEQLMEEEALPQRIFSAVKQPFDVVHINCHGKFDYNNPLDSYLLLAQGHELTVNDIRLQLRLKGRPLVALSACQTGRIRPERADEASSLAWAFLAAGASAVIASQWSVPDKATRELFEVFYSLRQAMLLSDAEALRQAMQQLHSIEAYRHYPYFWAAFQVTGLPIPA